MLRIVGAALTAAIGSMILDANAQGRCWDGTIVSDLNNCPKRPGAKQSSGAAGNDAIVQELKGTSQTSAAKGKSNTKKISKPKGTGPIVDTLSSAAGN